MTNNPIYDMLARLRNGQLAKKKLYTNLKTNYV